MLEHFQREMQAAAHHTLAEGWTLRWYWVVVAAFLAGLLGSCVGNYSDYKLYGRQLVGQAEFGQSVMSVWDRLDGKAKKLIESAY
jgi:hypothetical protein